jgi:lipoprotein-anchoring transpeptidase ErfK/SrfK
VYIQNRKDKAEALAAQYLALALLMYFGKDGPGAVPPPVPRSQHQHFKRAFLAVLAGCALAWVLGGLYGVRYEVRGVRVSARTPDPAIARLMQQKAGEYRLYLIRPDGKRHDFSLDDLGMYVEEATSVRIAHQKRWAVGTLAQWWRPVQVRLVIGADGPALQEFITKHATIPISTGRNAQLVIKDGAARIVPEKPGQEYGLDNAMHTILEAASHLRTTPLQMRKVDAKPDITATSLEASKAQLDGVLKQSIVFTAATKQIKPSRKDIGAWISIKPDPANKTARLSVNAGKFQAYVDGIAATYSSAPKSQVILGAGGVLPGALGVSIQSKGVVDAKLARQVLQGKGIRVELPATTTAFQTVRAPTYGKWVEVNLSTKRLYVYDRAVRVRTFLISAGAPATPTPTGTYAIYAKYTSQTMSGPNADGSRYVQPNVPWINYFYSDFALHGNYWRPTSYFGSVHSSHGCVGLMTSDAAWVYDWAPIGTPIVIHY